MRPDVAFDRVAFTIALALIFVGLCWCVYGCFNPFAPYGVQWKFDPKPTCRDFCAGDKGCMEGMCHGDPDTLHY